MIIYFDEATNWTKKQRAMANRIFRKFKKQYKLGRTSGVWCSWLSKDVK